jgi:hypothetical protein
MAACRASNSPKQSDRQATTAAIVLCERHGARKVIGVPIEDCAFWMRAIAADEFD